MIIENGFSIDDYGDPSVGIYGHHWELTGNFEFENQEEYDNFIHYLKWAYEYVTSMPVVIKPIDKII